MKHKKVVYIGVNLTPNERRDALHGLENAITNVQRDWIVAGNFNAKVFRCSEDRTDSRGRCVMGVVSLFELMVLKTDSTSTFRRPVYKDTIQNIF